MDFLGILLFLLVTVIIDRIDSKRNTPPRKNPLPRQPRRTPIEIPELKNEPRSTDKLIYQEHETVNLEEQLQKQAEEARLRELELEKKRREERTRQLEIENYERAAKLKPAKTLLRPRILPPLNPVNMRDAVVLSEIIGRPKAYRRK